MALPAVHFAYSGFCTCAKFNSYRRHGHQLTSLHVQAPDEASLEIWIDALRSYKEGYLTKQGAVVKNWKRRWFVLYKTQLAYFDGPSGGARRERKGYILLKEVLPGSVHPVDDASVGRQNTFQIEIKEQTFFLTGDTVDQMDGWLDSILRSIQTRGRLQSVAEALEADSLDPSQGGEVSRDSAEMAPLEANHQAALEAKMKEAQESDEEETAGYQAGGAAEGETNTGQVTERPPPEPEAEIGLGCIVTLYYTHPLHTRFPKRISASIPEATMRPNPRPRLCRLRRWERRPIRWGRAAIPGALLLYSAYGDFLYTL